MSKDACVRCQVRRITHEPCCSSHNKLLCCECYRFTHFMEVGNCCSHWAEKLS
jgi:hypothetical protein